MELAAFMPATTMIKLARINIEGVLAVRLTLSFIEYPFTISVFPFLLRDVFALLVLLNLFQKASVPLGFRFVFVQDLSLTVLEVPPAQGVQRAEPVDSVLAVLRALAVQQVV